MIAPIDMGIITPIMIVFCGVLMVVLRAGASRVFFDIVGTFEAKRMMQDVEASMTTMNAIVIDGLSGMEEAGAMVAEQMQKIVEATVPLSHELEMATLEFQKFIDMSEAGAEDIAGQVREAGLQFGFTSNEALEAGARMAQLSTLIGQKAVPAATEMALAFGLIGDMTPETAMQKLINLQQQTGFLYGESTKEAYRLLSSEEQVLQVRTEMAKTLNTLNKVEDNSAATMSKITGVMNEFASQAHLAGEEISMMAAMSATLIEAGEEQGKGGRALRMIYARLGADTGGSATALKSMGVEVKNADGSLRALSDILADLDPLWKQMNSGQKQSIAQMIAGNRHYVRFIKLAENYDRILDLNRATTEQMGEVYNDSGEAVGFLADMMDSHAVALDTARAKLELVNAEIGDFFIPTVIAATEFQILFNKEILNMLENTGALGDKLQGFFEFQQVMSSVFAPFFSAVINIKAMNVALMTSRQIMRALMGEQLKATTQSQAARAKQKAATESAIAAEKELLNMTVVQRLAAQEKMKIQMMADNKRKPAIKGEIMHLQMLIAAINKEKNAETELLMLQTKADNYNKIKDRNEKHRAKHSIVIMDGKIMKTTQSADVTKRHERYVREFRLAQEQLNWAINEEITLLTREQTKIQMRNIDFSTARVINDTFRLSVQKGTVATKLGTDAMEAQTAVAMRLSMTVMKIGMAFFVAEMLVMMFKDALPFVKDEADAARMAMTLMMIGMIVMTIEMVASTAALIANSAAKAENTSMNFVATASTWVLTRTVHASTAAYISNSAAFTILTGIMSGGIMIAAALAIAFAVSKYLMPAMKDATDTADDLSDQFAASDEAASQWASSMDDFDFDMGFLDDGIDKMGEFDNAREEMFFGFKAGQVTGDLIKQVQQGGVENFVANTEIIMNNNFNGMTTQEIADEIIEQVERRAGLSGLNPSIV